jgi:sterol desaturase/sphingolipid hydroxylase (fatty acid hydroxylase superfamily)
MANPALIGLPESSFVQTLYSDECLDTMHRWEGIDAKPDPENRKKRAGIRIFRSDVMERWFSKAHPVMPIVWTGPFIVFGWYRGLTGGHGGLPVTLGLFLGGVMLWSLLEYGLHRFVFHWQPKGTTGKLFSFMIHGYHHEFPDDKMRLVAPPLMLFTLGTVVGMLYRLIFGPAYWAQVFGGTAAGYVAYDWMHYYAHHFHPKRGIGSFIRRYHLMHHFQEGRKRYGISSPLWDLLFGTYQSPDR